MARKSENTEYIKLKNDVLAGNAGSLYIFYGEERYLLEYYLKQLRTLTVPQGLEEFNHKRFEGKKMNLAELAEAVDALPVFSQRTMIEIYDYDIFGAPEGDRQLILKMMSDVPEYICLVFIYDAVEFKTYGNLKHNSAIKKLFSVVEFQIQDKAEIIKWISRRFKSAAKRIDVQTAEYLAFITGCNMTLLVSEIDKIAAYCEESLVTKENIDAVVTPVLEAEIYELSDMIVRREYDGASKILSDLLMLQEVPHKIIYGIGSKMRQMLAARIILENGGNVKDLMQLCDIRFEFIARKIMDGVRKTGTDWCKKAVKLSSETAYKMNSSAGDNDKLLTDLLVNLALI